MSQALTFPQPNPASERVDWCSQALADRLTELADAHADSYLVAQPFPHVVIDDFLPAELLEPVLEAFPGPDELRWMKFDNGNEKKLAFRAAERMPVEARDLLYFLNSATVLAFLERLTGIPHLISDPLFSGGGLHQIEPGGKLGVHADFNWHEEMQVHRRLNLLLYLNKDWRDDYGGQLELWDRGMKACRKTVAPVFNRCVIFSTTSDSFHGHPHPLTCPEGRTRKSIATYYYSAHRPMAELAAEHSTLFRDKADRRKLLLKSLVPPILFDMARALRTYTYIDPATGRLPPPRKAERRPR